MSSHGGVDNNRSLIAKRGSGRDKHRKGHRGGGKTSTQTSGSGQGRSSHDDNSRGKRSQFLSREKKRVNLVNPMLGFGYDRNGSYITPKVSSITLASMMATEGFSESESEDDCSYLTDLAHKTHGDKCTLLQKRHYLRGPGTEEWRKALGFAVRDSLGNPV